MNDSFKSALAVVAAVVFVVFILALIGLGLSSYRPHEDENKVWADAGCWTYRAQCKTMNPGMGVGTGQTHECEKKSDYPHPFVLDGKIYKPWAACGKVDTAAEDALRRDLILEAIATNDAAPLEAHLHLFTNPALTQIICQLNPEKMKDLPRLTALCNP